MDPMVRFVTAAVVGAGLMLVDGRPAAAQDWAKAGLEKSSRHREYVAVKSGSRTVNTFVVYPETKGKAPVVVLIHEIFGLSDWAKEMADEIAAKGYIVVTPDLLSGFGPAAPGGGGTSSMAGMPGMAADDHAHGAPASPGAPFVAAEPGGTDAFPTQDAVTKAVSGLDAGLVNAELQAVSDYAEQLPASDGKLAVVGFCWGGGKAFALATKRPDLRAAFVFYGPPPPASDMAAIKAPVYGFYAGNDARIGATVPGTVAAMKAAGKVYEPVTYEGAGHGFMRAGQAPDASDPNRKAWDEGFARMLKQLAAMK